MRKSWVPNALAAVIAAAIMTGVTGGLGKKPVARVIALPDSLPIYELEQPDTVSFMRQLESFGAQGLIGTWQDRGDRAVLDVDSLHAEVFKLSNGIWFENKLRLWNTSEHPVLPSRDSVRALARWYVRRLLPDLPVPLTYATIEGKTLTVTFDTSGHKRTPARELDHKLTFRMEVRVGGVGAVPVTGGGGEMTVAIGDRGKLLQLSGAVRRVRGLYRMARTVPRAEADRQFLARSRGARLTGWDASLAYYAAPGSYRQRFLYPVWVYTATIRIGRSETRVRAQIIPATTFVPLSDVPAQLEPTGRRLDPADLAGSTPDSDTEPGNVPRREAGAVYFARTLPQAEENKKGFVDALSGAGWKINFDEGDATAYETAWYRLDDADDGVDAADFVFYTGHAGEDFWDAVQPDNDRFVADRLGPKPGDDVWGRNDLEWLVIAACGPLQDSVIGFQNVDVFRTWQGAFDGLHLFMGFGSVSQDNNLEGRMLAGAALAGDPIAHAWLRVAQDVQPTVVDGSPVWAAVVFAVRNGESTEDDHLWGRGWVAADPRFPEKLVAIWTTT